MGAERHRPRGAGGARAIGERFRRALAEVEEQRDDAVVYLSAIKAVIDALAVSQDTRTCGQRITDAMIRQLHVESCAIAVREPPGGPLALVGFASQSQRFGGSGTDFPAGAWLTLAGLVGTSSGPTCFRRLPDGSFEAANAAELRDEGFVVLPCTVGDEPGGALVLHSLAAPAQSFARARALALLAEIVGQALTIASTRESTQRLCRDLESELGATRGRLSKQQESMDTQEQSIRSLTRDLIRSNRVKREFLGTVSHELRTPLNAILGYASLVRDGLVGPVSDEQTTLLDRVLSNSRNLNALIDDMLFFVQVEADRVLVRREAVTLPELVEEVASSIPERAAKPGVSLQVEIASEAETVLCDTALLRRMLFHLLGNAFKFTAEGDVRLTIRPADEAGAVLLVVSDTGVGIPPEKIADVFDLFSQGDGSTTRRYSGLGMGLTLVQRCVRLLDGAVEVDSRPGVGSEFRIRLPRVLGDADVEAGARTVGSTLSQSRTVH
jgi:signal transduction histidine kinase